MSYIITIVFHSVMMCDHIICVANITQRRQPLENYVPSDDATIRMTYGTISPLLGAVSPCPGAALCAVMVIYMCTQNVTSNK
jgi:hypothetical protein